MLESFLQERIAERIGASSFGKENKIYKFEKIKRAKRAALAANPKAEIIDMGVGEPDDMAFSEVVEALCREASKWENRTYTDNGIQEFKDAAAKYMGDLYGVSIDPEKEICHAIGSKSALSLFPACFVNPGDLTVMTVPGYPVLGTWTKYLGGEVLNLPLSEENNFFPEFDKIPKEKLSRVKLLYLNYPNNPTGYLATIEQFRQALDFAKKNKILIISDAAYAPLNFKGKPLSILSLSEAKDCAVELHSMSKGFNMTGWRLSWVCGNELAVKAFATVKDNADSGQFAAIQKAAIEALRRQDKITPAISAKYERRLRFMTDSLRGIGFPAKMPEGSFYLYVKCPRSLAGGREFSSAEEFSEWLIKEKYISTVPWDDVGAYLRFSATFVARGGEGEEKRVLAEFAKRLSGLKFEF